MQQSLYEQLDEYVREKRLTDLHTHLMGMGSANFWVKKIIEKYIHLKEKGEKRIVKYSLLDLLLATGILPAPNGSFERSIQYSRLESRFFDSIDNQNFASLFNENKTSPAVLETTGPRSKKPRVDGSGSSGGGSSSSSSSGGGGGGGGGGRDVEFNKHLEDDSHYITNSQLLMLLDLDAKSTNPGNLMSIIRNSFEFLSKAGTDPTSFDCHSCKC